MKHVTLIPAVLTLLFLWVESLPVHARLRMLPAEAYDRIDSYVLQNLQESLEIIQGSKDFELLNTFKAKTATGVWGAL